MSKLSKYRNKIKNIYGQDLLGELSDITNLYRRIKK